MSGFLPAGIYVAPDDRGHDPRIDGELELDPTLEASVVEPECEHELEFWGRYHWGQPIYQCQVCGLFVDGRDEDGERADLMIAQRRRIA